MGDIGLKNRGGALFQHLAEAPLGKETLACGYRQVRSSGNIYQGIHILAIDRLLDKHRLIRLQRLDEKHRCGRWHRAVKVNRNVNIRPRLGAHGGELVAHRLDKAGCLDQARRTASRNTGLDSRVALRELRPHIGRALPRVIAEATVRVDTYLVACRAAQ